MVILVIVVGVVLLLRFVDPPTWSWKLQREFNPPAGYPKQPRHHWLELDQIAPAVLLAVIASEDQRFPNHHGIDFDAIYKAVEGAVRGRRLRGASTLTQQTAKNLFLWSRRDFSRKFMEVGLALLLELIWDKHRILEVYLNIVEFGPGIYGIEAASEYWYHQSADSITERQAARLAAVLPSPWKYRAEPATPYVAERARWIEQQMDQLGYAWLAPMGD
ncbi:MAG: monofunctional biosynthetic peptidoglycan transglycosylase [Candidatus Thiodiazotropha sp.]